MFGKIAQGCLTLTPNDGLDERCMAWAIYEGKLKFVIVTVTDVGWKINRK